MTQKPPAYSGNAPYIFISYAHADAERVYPIIEGLQKRGMRVWYDEAIPAGSKWDAQISHVLTKSSCAICFLSKAFLASENCGDEIFYAKEEGKGPLLVYIENIKLPEDMKFRYGRLHALKYLPGDDTDAFLDKLALAEILRPCCADARLLPKVKQTVRENPRANTYSYYEETPRSKPAVNGKMIGLIAGAAAVLLLVVAAIFLLPGLGGGGGIGGAKDPGTQYAEAMALIEQGSYYDAYVLLEQLGNYEDSAAQLAAIRDQALLQKLGTAKKGDTVLWGSYEQDDDESNGKEAIEWIVLQVSGGKVLLLSTKGLDCQPYHGKEAKVSWETCDLRQWLNEDFYDEAFSENEKKAIAKQLITTEGSNDTYDSVFLLGKDEAEVNYYWKQLSKMELTAYAIRQGANRERWWLRCPWNAYGIQNADWALVGSEYKNADTPSVTMDKVNKDGNAVRPCIWVDTRSAAQQEQAYAEAVSLFTGKQYKKALEAFQNLGDYKDCVQYCARIPKLMQMEIFVQANKGDTVTFGSAEWILLEKQDGKALVISKYALEAKSFHDYSLATPGWENCTLRQWLNGGYLSGNFSDLEREIILSETLSNDPNPVSNASSGNATTDRVFLLSYDEVTRYMPQNSERQVTKKDSTIQVAWWLRTAGQSTGKACYVDKNGAVNTDGDYVFLLNSSYYVRPAMWIDIEE